VRRPLALLPLCVLLAACGGSHSSKSSTSAPGPKLIPLAEQGPLGTGPREVWWFASKGKARSLVVFLHGYGGPVEETPKNHVPFLRHLAAQGSDVIYPRYEVSLSTDQYADIDAAIATARAHLGDPHVPVIVVGYSRGGRLAVDYAAYRAMNGRPPVGVLAIYPAVYADFERLISFKHLDPKMKLTMLLGDKDTDVDGTGARTILARLELANFPIANVKVIVVRSTKAFTANHLSLMNTGPTARREIWGPADRFIASVR
jgi:pimeloyl-ACP methyl ester carboxylesterase